MLSAEQAQLIESLRLTHRDASVRFIYELACEHVAAHGLRATLERRSSNRKWADKL